MFLFHDTNASSKRSLQYIDMAVDDVMHLNPGCITLLYTLIKFQLIDMLYPHTLGTDLVLELMPACLLAYLEAKVKLKTKS